MVEGDNVFKEAIQFLKSLPPLQPLQWDPNLARSAQEHVDDIGPKGLLLYQSSDGTEPEDRISKYGTYVESLGENIDFGPNDAMGVIISLTLDDGEEERPHRENLFKSDYQKVGIACGPHKTEFQMCVMDFAYDFKPLNAGNEMKEHVGIDMQHYAFPFGEASAVSQHDIQLVKGLGFKTSATTKDGFVCYGTDPLELPRIFVTEKNWKQVIDRIIANC